MQAVQQKTVNRATTVQKPAASIKGVQRQAVAAKGSLQLQSSLKVSSPKDPAEKEADTTAKKIMRMAVPESSISYVRTGDQGVFRQIKKEEKDKKIQTKLQSPYITRFANTGIFTQSKKKEEEKIQRKAEGQPNVAANVSADIQNSMATGSPLPLSVRRFMEPRFQANFSNVKIHTGDQSAKLNRQLNAQAFTVGNQIFFGKDKFQPEQSEGKELIAHELTHTIQQGAAIQSSSPVLQRLEFSLPDINIPNPLDYLIDKVTDFAKEKAEKLPGFVMLTVVMGKNPISGAKVDRTPGKILEGAIQMIPVVGNEIANALNNHGIFDKVSQWILQKFESLKEIGASVWTNVKDFIKNFSLTQLKNPGAVWEKAKSIVMTPIDEIKKFASGLVGDITNFVKDAILKPLAAFVKGKAPNGYDLLSVILSADPISGETVKPTAENTIGPFMRMIGKEEIWRNLQQGKAIPRAWAWFKGAMQGLIDFAKTIPKKVIDTLKSLTIEDIVTIAGAFSKIVGAFGSIAGKFISWATDQVLDLLEILFSVVAPGVMPYIKKAQAAFTTIVKNPIGFVGNLVRAGKLGFQMFAGNILTHLKTALIKWLVGPLAEAGVYIPQSFSLIEIVKLVLSVLGLTWQNIRSKLVKIIPEPVLVGLEKTASILVTLVKDGPAAAWEQIKAELTQLKDQLIAQVTEMISTEVVKAAITKLVSMLNPAGAVVQAIIAIYNTVTFFIQKINQIAAVVASFIDSISAIAAGQVAGAAKKVETTMANTLTVVIAFLAKFAGLGNIPNKLVGIVKKIRAPIDKGLDKIVAWLGKMLDKAKALFGKKDKPDERSQEQKKADLTKGIAEAQKFLEDKKLSSEQVKQKLPAIKSKYNITIFELVTDAKSETKETAHIHGEIHSNPVKHDSGKIEKEADIDVGVTVGQKVLVKVGGDWKLADIDKLDGDKQLVWSKLVDGKLGLPFATFKTSFSGGYTVVRPFDPQAKGNGKYKHLPDLANVGPYKYFTAVQKSAIIADNRSKHSGSLVSDGGGGLVVLTTKRARGSKVNPDEVNIDHIFPRSQGGWNSYANAQVLSFSENLKKRDTIPEVF